MPDEQPSESSRNASGNIRKDTDLTPQQEIAAIALANGATIEEASKKCHRAVPTVNTALSIAHWAEESDALPIIRVALPIVPFASCLLQEPIPYATMPLR